MSMPVTPITPAPREPTLVFTKVDGDTNLELAMPAALRAGEFVAYYQPLVSSTGELRGCEALMRWLRPDGTVISPVDFIPVAERTGFITTLGAFVLGEAVKQLRVFEAAGVDMQYMSVNVSPRQLEYPEFETILEQVLLDADVAPHRLVLEITEGVSMVDKASMHALMDRIAATGVRLALDDYGTGYSSLGHLKAFPVSALKIDRSFIHDVAENDVAGIIVQAIVNLSRALNLEIVAEGVETHEQARVLREMGVTIMQGFLYGKPMPADELVARFGTTLPTED